MSEAADLAKAALARGDLIAAYDVTTAAIEEGDPGGTIRHQQVLALARMGDTERAMGLFSAYGLDGSSNAARARDRRAAAQGPGARRAARPRAAGGDGARVRGLSRRSIATAAIPSPASTPRPWRCSPGDVAQSQALARALLADPAVAARRRLLQGGDPGRGAAAARPHRRGDRDAGQRGGARAAAISAAARARCASSPWSPPISASARRERAALLAPLAPPRVAHYCGHMFGADAAGRGADPRARSTRCWTRRRSASPMARSPAAPTSSPPRRCSIAASSSTSCCRSRRRISCSSRCCPAGRTGRRATAPAATRAASVVFASPMAYFGNPAQYGYASRTAMGLARLRAEHLAAEAVQIAIWDGAALGRAGRDGRRRRRLGGGGRADPDRRSGRGRARPRPARAAGDDPL